MTKSTAGLVSALTIVAALLTPAFGQQQSEHERKLGEIRKLGWQAGPSEGPIAGRARIKVPEGYVYLGADDTARFLVLLENLPTKNSYTFAPRALDWFSVFDYSDTGYIKDDEKIDPDAILKVLKEGTERENTERTKRGYPALELEGWAVPPHYDTETKRLEWATKLKSSGGVSINYSIRLLGRTGVMNAVLVTDPASLDADIRTFKTALGGFSFDSGERYAEYRVGDKIAEYGLTGLIVGGAAALAAKSGLLKVLLKFGIYIFAAVAAFAGGIFKWFSGRRKQA